jgi:hypothetical protein
MRYCSHCGKEVSEEADVCINCGCALHDRPHGGRPPFDGPDDRHFGGPDRPDRPPFDGPCGRPSMYRPIDTMSLLGFILAFFIPLAGLIVSAIAYNRLKVTDDERSTGYAKAGLILSIVMLIVDFIVGILVGIILIALISGGIMLM